MTDTEMLNWVAENLVSLHAVNAKFVTITYIGDFGYLLKVSGTDLRDCIRKATT